MGIRIWAAEYHRQPLARVCVRTACCWVSRRPWQILRSQALDAVWSVPVIVPVGSDCSQNLRLALGTGIVALESQHRRRWKGLEIDCGLREEPHGRRVQGDDTDYGQDLQWPSKAPHAPSI